jgi:hypothetical protein
MASVVKLTLEGEKAKAAMMLTVEAYRSGPDEINVRLLSFSSQHGDDAPESDWEENWEQWVQLKR